MAEFPDIPVIGIGPGSQEDGAGLEYMVMPGDMRTYQPPPLPEPELAAQHGPALRVLEAVATALERHPTGEPVQCIDLDGLAASDRNFLGQCLGEGEVSVIRDTHPRIRAQESVWAGVWRVQHLDAHERAIRDTLELGAVPECVRRLSFDQASTHLDTHYDAGDAALQNAPALLVELAERLADYRPGDPAHTLNLSLLPLSDADLGLLGERLGVGPVTVLSRGYGNCRIGSTALRHLWWIKYFNSQDALILNTLELVDVPTVALAAAEDIADSRARLQDLLALYT